MSIRVLVNGALGKMGQATLKMVESQNDLELVAACDHEDDLASEIKASQAQVVVDFTTAHAGFENAKTIIASGAHPVIGTSGLLPEQIQQLTQQCEEKHLGGIIAPNFALGAVLLMKFSKEAAAYFPEVEIIEMHHDQKADAPSGTALKTAQLIEEGRQQAPKTLNETELIEGARGAKVHEVPTHSVRLPGLIAHQMVVFGGEGQTLTLRHDSLSRESFMSGVAFACRQVSSLKTLVYGLEKLL